MRHPNSMSVRDFCLSLGILLLIPLPSLAGNGYLPALRQEAAAWLSKQVAEVYPDSLAQVEMGPLDERLRLAACDRVQFFLPVGARLWSGGALGVKCAAPSPWSLFLTYQVQLTGPALLAQRPLPARHPLGLGDVALGNVRYEQDPGSYVREIPPGATTLRPMNANQPILVQDLLLPDIIQAGAKVRVRVQGRGFSVAQEGKALNSSKAGGPVQVKMPTGRIVRGVANGAGEVEVRP